MLLDLHQLIKKHHLKINGIIHVGAHTFEEKPIYDELGVKCYWIEANARLCVNFKETEKHKLFNFAASDKKERAEFYITNNIASSSLLKLKDHLKHHPKIHHEKTVIVQTNTIDSLNITGANFMNLDIQGAELLALKGAAQTLKHINYIYTEVNEAEMYENCCFISDLDKFLKDFKRVETYITRYPWGDALYIRK